MGEGAGGEAIRGYGEGGGRCRDRRHGDRGELHADEESVLLERGSRQSGLWGINLYPDAYPGEDWVEFDSMINSRPGQGNRSRSVDDPHTQEEIRAVVARLVRSDG